jgi:predicted TIM-barrel fold metal-dependent hydrolase
VADELTLFSVDDHVIEPPNVWQDRLPAKYRDVGPRVVVLETGPDNPLIPKKQKEHVVHREGGIEFWAYEDTLIPMAGLQAVAGKHREEYGFDPVNFSEMRAGCFEPQARVEDMDLDGIVASLSFPSYPRFAGQLFLEGKDKELARLCVQAYNDWMLDEWCATAPGRLVPMCVLPLWDPSRCVDEIERVAAKGARAVSFTENPAKLGLPSIHDADRHWDPVFAAMADADMPLCMHIGSSSDTVLTAPDAPVDVYIALVPLNALITCTDWLLSGVFVRHERLNVALSEGGIGWIPWVLERADYTWEHQGAWTGTTLPEPPSHYFHRQVYGCFIHDPHGAACIDEIGVDKVMIEVDYPHSDSTWPDSRQAAAKSLAHLDDDAVRNVTRGNAERLFRFSPSELGQR